MAESFIDQVSNLASQTHKILNMISAELDQAGLASQAKILKVVADQHKKMLHNCLTATQPISVRTEAEERLAKAISDINELSSEAFEREKEHREELEKASKILQETLKSMSKH